MYIPDNLKQYLILEKTYLVGGAIRDYLLGLVNIKDFDFVIFDLIDLKGFSQDLANKTNSSFIELDPENGIYRIVNENWQADFAKPRGLTLKEDLLGRDFSINSLACNLKNNEIIDCTDGQIDLKEKQIKALSEDNLKDDPLRLLRAFRFAVQKGFSIDEQTQKWIKQNAHLINQVATERISFELWCICEQNNCFSCLQSLTESGLWEILFPEFKLLREIPPNDFHHLPLLEHTFELVKQYEEIIQYKFPSLEYMKSTYLSGISLIAIMKMACLFHDLGKPATWKIIDKKHTFYGHDALGAEITNSICKKFNWSKQITNTLKQLVKHHLRPFQMAEVGSEPTEKAERRFFRQLNNDFIPLIALAWADLLSIRGHLVTKEIIQNGEKRLLHLLNKYDEFTKQEEKELPLLSGDLLVMAIEKAKLPASKIIKELLIELRELQLSKQINTTEEAFEWFITNGKQKTF